MNVLRTRLAKRVTAAAAALAGLSVVAAGVAVVSLPATEAAAANRPLSFYGVEAARFGDRDLVIATGSDNAGTHQVYYKLGVGGSVPNWGDDEWRQVPGGGLSGFDPATTRGHEVNYVAVVGLDGQLWLQYAFDFGSPEPLWMDRWEKIPGDLPGGIASNPSIHYNSELQQLVVAVVNQNKKPMVRRLNTVTQQWGSWEQLSLPAPLLFPNSAGMRSGINVTSVAGKTVYAIVDQNKQVWVGRETSNFGVVGWAAASGPGTTEMTPTLVQSPSWMMTLFVQGVGPTAGMYFKSASPAGMDVLAPGAWSQPFAEVPGSGRLRRDEWGAHPSVSTDRTGAHMRLYGLGGADFPRSLPWTTSVRSSGFSFGLEFSSGFNGWQRVPTRLDSEPLPPTTQPPLPPTTQPPTTPPVQKPDLVWVGGHSVSNTGKVSMTFKNAGGKAGSFRLSLFFDGVNVQDLPYTGMGAGSSDTITFETSALEAGRDHQILVNLDSYSAVAESNENNNEYHFPIAK
jgi:hypothetical protein